MIMIIIPMLMFHAHRVAALLDGPPMYVCICNAITDNDVQSKIEAGAQTADAVYAACGATPQCRMCSDTIEDMINVVCDATLCPTSQQISPPQRYAPAGNSEDWFAR